MEKIKKCNHQIKLKFIDTLLYAVELPKGWVQGDRVPLKIFYNCKNKKNYDSLKKFINLFEEKNVPFPGKNSGYATDFMDIL